MPIESCMEFLCNFPDAIIVFDKNKGRIIYANQAALHLFGYEREELIGKSILDIHPMEERKKIDSIIRKLKANLQGYYCDINCLNKCGEIFPVDIASQIFKYNGSNLAMGFIRDRRKIRSEATDWRVIYQQLAELAGYGVCLVSGKRILYANNWLSLMLGVDSPAALKNREMTDFLPPEAHEPFHVNYEKVISGIAPVLCVKRYLKRLDGTIVCCYARMSRVLVEGEWVVHSVLMNPENSYCELFKPGDPFPDEKMPESFFLTCRETEVLKMFAAGSSVKEVARKLNISERTARTHRYNIMRKLQVNNTAEMTRFAIKNNMVAL